MRRSIPFCLAMLAAPAVQAAEPSADLRGLYAPLSHEAGLTLEPVASPGSGDLTASTRVSYAFLPVVLRGASGDIRHAVIEHQFTGDFMVSVGLFERLTVGVDLPVVLGQTGDEVRFDPEAVRLVGEDPPPLTALGDVGLRAKVTIVKPEVDEQGLSRGFAFGFDDRFTAPSGDERSFIGEGVVTNETRLLAELAYGPVLGHLRAGAKFRGDVGTYACEPDAPVDDCTSRFGHELPLGFGLALRPKAIGIDPDGIGTLFVETRAYLPLYPVTPDQSFAPAGWFASLAGRVRIGDVALIGGVEAALNDGVGNAPFRATIGLSVAPRKADKDRDGVGDDVDRCPTFAEDVDGFEDVDGCPEMDNDADGVPDGLDKCPVIPGKSGDDGDGCPAA
jgi:hypothetical protein